MEAEKNKQPSRKLKDIVSAPFIFKLKDGTQLGLDDWTLFSEQWAQKNFGSLQVFYSTVFETPTKPGVTEDEMTAAVNASVSVAAYQLDRDSRRKVSELIAKNPSGEDDQEAMTTEEFLARNLRYADFRLLCSAIMDMLQSSWPEGWEELAKKKHSAQVNPNSRKK